MLNDKPLCCLISQPKNLLTRRFALPPPKPACCQPLFVLVACITPAPYKKKKNKAKDPEDQALVKLPAWHELRLALNKANLGDVWQQISVAALDGQPETLDQIAWVLSVYQRR